MKRKNRGALLAFLRKRKRTDNPSTVGSVVHKPEEMLDYLENISRELQKRCTAILRAIILEVDPGLDFSAVTMEEMAFAIMRLPAASPGTDGISTFCIKLRFQKSPQSLLNIANTSVEKSWIPAHWKIAKIVTLLRNPSPETIPESILPITLTSNLVKLVERILHGRLLRFLSKENIVATRSRMGGLQLVY